MALGNASLGAAVLAACTLACAIVALSTFARPSVLISTPHLFDSNMPVQWEAHSVRTDLGDLSRYYSSAGADLKRLPEARTVDLAQVPSDGFRVSSWSKKHRAAVGAGVVDEQSAKGVWHSGTEAWKGIDEVFPTDTPYAYEVDHENRVETAKMKTFIDHVRNQLATLEDKLPRVASSAADKAELVSMQKVLDASKIALAKVEYSVQHTRPSHATKVSVTSQLRSVAAAAPAPPVRGLRAHYISSKGARSDIASYFNTLDAATEHENMVNARASGASVPTDQLLVTTNSGEDGRRMDMQEMASDFSAQLRQVLDDGSEATKQPEEACSLCVKIFGCKDCCEPVCEKVAEDKIHAARASSSSSSKAAGAGRSQLPRMPCMCTTQECKECPQEGARRSSSGNQLSRLPCTCTTKECKECAPNEDDQSSARKYQAELAKEHGVLRAADRAVSKTNDILKARISALEEANSRYSKETGLKGVYGDESDDEVWSSREPSPGKSEQIAGGASDVIHQLIHEVGLAKARSQQLRRRLHRVEKVALQGAEVTAEQRQEIAALHQKVNTQEAAQEALQARFQAQRDARMVGLTRYGGYGVRSVAESISRPFFEATSKGRRQTREALNFYVRHPRQVAMDMGPHAILSGQ